MGKRVGGDDPLQNKIFLTKLFKMLCGLARNIQKHNVTVVHAMPRNKVLKFDSNQHMQKHDIVLEYRLIKNVKII